MTFRTPAVVAALTVLGLAADAAAQPIAPRRPNYSSYNSLFAPGGYYGYGAGAPGLGGFGYGFGPGGFNGFGGIGGIGGFNGFGGVGQQQNMMMQQMLAATNQNMANLQTYLATGVNPNFPVTGRGAVFNNLGHWYPAAPNGGGFGGMMGGGFGGTMGRGTAGMGYGVGGAPGGAGAAGAGPTTAGNGIALPRR